MRRACVSVCVWQRRRASDLPAAPCWCWDWEGLTKDMRAESSMLRTLVLATSSVATAHAHAILLKPSMRMNPGWPRLSKGHYGPVGKPPWSSAPYYPYACNFAGGHNCGGALCYKHDNISDCEVSKCVASKLAQAPFQLVSPALTPLSLLTRADLPSWDCPH